MFESLSPLDPDETVSIEQFQEELNTLNVRRLDYPQNEEILQNLFPQEMTWKEWAVRFNVIIKSPDGFRNSCPMTQYTVLQFTKRVDSCTIMTSIPYHFHDYCQVSETVMTSDFVEHFYHRLEKLRLTRPIKSASELLRLAKTVYPEMKVEDENVLLQMDIGSRKRKENTDVVEKKQKCQ